MLAPTKTEETCSKSKKQHRRWWSNINARQRGCGPAGIAGCDSSSSSSSQGDCRWLTDERWCNVDRIRALGRRAQFRPSVTTKIRQTNTREQEAGDGAKRDGMKEQREPRWIHGTSRSGTWPTSLLDIKRRDASCRCPLPPTVHPAPINRRRPADVTIDGRRRWRQCRFDGAGYQLASAAISCCVRC